jgi:hypothetical protein
VKARSCRSYRHRRKPHRIGCGLAFAGLALVFAGVIGVGWLAVIAALYAMRWMKAQRARPVAQRAEERLVEPEQAPADTTLERLDRLVAQARPHLPDELAARLYSVRCSVAQALPWLIEAPSREADLYTVRETVRRYLPDTLTSYFAVPAALRTGHAVKDGKTAAQLLAEQLALLDEEMREIASKAASGDVQALVANGRFLEARFRRGDFVPG